MATKDQIENEPVEVAWSEEPLDVSLEKHGNKKPDRKVKVRGILRDAWLKIVVPPLEEMQECP